MRNQQAQSEQLASTNHAIHSGGWRLVALGLACATIVGVIACNDDHECRIEGCQCEYNAVSVPRTA